MYLKYIRESFPCGEIHRGKLYSVHFEPNEKGDYNEHLTLISEVYECVTSERMNETIVRDEARKELKNERTDQLPLPLIYPVGVVRINGFVRLTLGDYHRRSMLHLINREARESFFAELRNLILARIDVRMEVQ